MQKKIVLVCSICLVFIIFSGCIGDTTTRDDEIKQLIDCEPYNVDEGDGTIVWIVSNVEDESIRWDDYSWELISEDNLEKDEDASLVFSDKNNDGNISVNDFFTVTTLKQGNYIFRIFHKTTNEYIFESPAIEYMIIPSLALRQVDFNSSEGEINYQVMAVSSNAKWSHLRIMLSDNTLVFNETAIDISDLQDKEWFWQCDSSVDDSINATANIYVKSTETIQGDEMRIIHSPSETIMIIMTIS